MAINPLLASSSGATGQTPSSSTQLDMTEFLKLLTVQLSSQDPLNPTSDSEFFAQLAQMGTVQGVDALKQSMNVSQAASLMGKTVSAITVDPSTGSSVSVTGVVSKLTIYNGQYLLDIKDAKGNVATVPMGNVVTVAD